MCSVIHNPRKQLIEKEQKMIKIPHSLNFVTEVDETHPVGMQLLALSQEMRIAMLEGMLKELLAPAIQPVIDHLNENGSFAILKVAD
jgi:hypothetical protein